MDGRTACAVVALVASAALGMGKLGATAEAAPPSGWTAASVIAWGENVRQFALGGRGTVVWTDYSASQFPVGKIWRDGATFKAGSYAGAVNGNGQVAGYSYLWTDGKFTDLGATLPPHTHNIAPLALNDRGQVVGILEYLAPPPKPATPQHGFLWQSGKLTDLGDFLPVAINERGQIAGTRSGKAFLWQSGKLKLRLAEIGLAFSPAVVTDRGQVYGSVSGGQHVLWQDGTIAELDRLGGRASTPVAVNALGQVVGSYRTATLAAHAFIWQAEKLTDLGTLGGKRSFAVTVNDRGEVVGTSDTRAGALHAFLWRAGRMTDIGQLEPLALNNDGQILGVSKGKVVLWTPPRTR